MTAAAIAATATAAMAATLMLGVLLAIWLPAWTAGTLTLALLGDEARRGLRRWRATRKWAARLSA
jgi:hypothetical protein